MPPDTAERRPAEGGAQDGGKHVKAHGSRYGLHIFDQHADLLAKSAIDPAVARERGYVSVDTGTQLERAGFAKSQRRPPGLLIPIWGTDGTVRLAQYRPDPERARKINGKTVKYETPFGQRLCLDVPPRARPALTDLAVPLWVTEGARKADAAVSAGLCCVALLGVDSYRFPDWDDVLLRDRDVFVCFDSDVMTKPGPAGALARFTDWLASTRGAKVRHVILPTGEGGAKTGLDDYLGAGHSVAELAALARDPVITAPALEATWDGDAAALLDGVAAFLRSYVAFPSSHAAVAVTLWAAHTHVAAALDSTPRLALLSPEKQCGKSRVLELLELLCAGAETLSDASPAYLYRRIDAGTVTILLDEADAIWKRGKADETAEALRSIVNAGHRKSATVGRVEMNGQAAKLTRFKVYAPAAIAGIGNLPDTIMDRAVVVRMRRRAPDEPVRDYRERVTRPEGVALREKLATWAADAAKGVGDPWPDLPPGVADRAADVWEALVMVADLAGGDWPKLAREACTAFVDGTRDDTETIGTRLLADLRDIFGDAREVSTQDILAALAAMDEAPWADWYGHPLNPRDLAKLLKPYGIRSRQIPTGNVKGYRREDLHEAWRSYLALGSETSETSETSLASHVSQVSDVSPPRPGCAVCGDPLDPALAAAGYATIPRAIPMRRQAGD